jgi:hypothetical protein
MLEYKINVAAWTPIRLLDAFGVPLTGVAYSTVTGAVTKSDTTSATLTITNVDWVELTTGAFSGSGTYLLKLPNTALNTEGFVNVAVAHAGASTFVGIIEVVTISDATTVADAVWDALTTGNITAGTMGGLVNTAASGPSLSSIAGAVWDEASAGHVAAGSFGKLEEDIKVAVDAINIETDAASIAAAVWDTALASHTTAGTFGQTLQLEDSGLVQASGASTVTLKAGASAVTDFYQNGLITITSGTGVGQSRSITAYNGTTKVATVDRAWGTAPVASDGYIVLPAAPSSSLTNAGIAGAVWDVTLAGHLTAGSTGLALNATATAGAPYVQFHANGDTVAPYILQVVSPKHTQVRVTFSEAVVMTNGVNGALNIANYTIPGLTIINIVSVTDQQILMTTSPQAPDFLYSLTIQNVEDLQGNIIGNMPQN